MLNRPDETEKKSEEVPVFGKGQTVFRRWLDRGVVAAKNTWQDLVSSAEYAAYEYPRLYVLMPFMLTAVSASYALPAGAMFAKTLELEYLINCYTRPPETTQGNLMCKVAPWFGAPDYEDFQKYLEARMDEEGKATISVIQKDCKDELGSWLVGTHSIDNFTTVNCEDKNDDGTPDAVHYSGSGEDVSYSLKTGREI